MKRPRRPASRTPKKSPPHGGGARARRHKPGSQTPSSIQVLYEDNHCLAISKPAGMLTAGDRTGDTSLLELAREYIRTKHQKPGNVFLGLVHRLDRPVSGIVLFAKTSKGARRLSEQFRNGTISKTYFAWVQGKVVPAEGILKHTLAKDGRRNVVAPVAATTPGARDAWLEYRIVKRGASHTLLEIRPHTGRSHQIRVQLAARGNPIAGDVKYGNYGVIPGKIALHAAQLEFDHPVRHIPIRICDPLPAEWDHAYA